MNRDASRPVPLALALLVAALLGGAATDARADIILSVQSPAPVAPNSVGNVFEITLENTDPTDQLVSAFNLTIANVNPNVIFTSGDTNTSLPYIFAGAVDPAGFSFATPSAFPGTGNSFDADDSLGINPPSVNLMAGTTRGVARIFFDAGATPGTYALNFFTGFSATEVIDDQGNPIALTLQGGSVTITGAAAVPEPSTWALALVGVAILGAARRGRRRTNP